jgi:hypothetical protein
MRRCGNSSFLKSIFDYSCLFDHKFGKKNVTIISIKKAENKFFAVITQITDHSLYGSRALQVYVDLLPVFGHD